MVESSNMTPTMDMMKWRDVAVLLLLLLCSCGYAASTDADTPTTTPSYPDDAQKRPLEIPYVKLRQFKPAGDTFEVNVDVDWGPQADGEEMKVLKTVSRLFSNKCRNAIDKCTIGQGSYVNDMCGFARRDTCYDLNVDYQCDDEKTRRPSCLFEEGCSKPEIVWLFNAACDYMYDSFRFEIGVSPPWDTMPWFANDALKLSFLLPFKTGDLRYQCQREFLECLTKTTPDDTSSYCGMFVDLNPVWGSPVRHLRNDCVRTECSEMLPAIIDAACTRSVINWSGPWFAGTRLQVAVAAFTSVPCQDQFVTCREILNDQHNNLTANVTQDEREASPPNYCTLVTAHVGCLLTGGACTRVETGALYAGACSSEQFNWLTSRAVSIATAGPMMMVVLMVMGLVVRSELTMA